MAEADNGVGHKVLVNKYDTKIVKTEDESALSKGGVVPVVINEDETNMWGSPRGYKVSSRTQSLSQGRTPHLQ
jgi:hypothetical protein